METNAKMLERVRALLAKADSTNYPAEADTFRAKADALMAQYAIDQWMVDAAKDSVGQVAKPEKRDFDFSWFSYNNPRADELWSLFSSTANHCRCVVAIRGMNWSNGKKMPLLGLPSDLGYFDLLFTHLMLQMGKGLEPKPREGQSYLDALVMMKEAGMKWERIGNLLIDAGLMEGPYTRNVGVRFTKEYTDHCAAEGRPRLRVAPSVYQRSFAIGFVQEIRARFLSMSRAQETASEGESNALALRDIRQVARDLYNELYPPPEDTGRKSRGRSLVREVKIDWFAYETGKQAGREADISGSPQHGLRNQPKEIGS